MAKILFLAQFAPENGQLLIKPQNAEEEFYAKTYHFKIIESLKKLGYDFYSTSDVNHLINEHINYDLVWSVYNRLGFRNSEIFVQSICEYFGIKYIGAAPNIRAIIEDKSVSKLLAEHLGLNTAKWITAINEHTLSNTPPFNGPYFVKPRFGSASIGIDESCICKDWSSVLVKANKYFKNNIEVIIEEYIDGTYFGVPIINKFDSSPIIARPHFQLSNKSGGVITYSQKRFTETGMTRYMSKNEELNKILINMANIYFLQIQPCDYARIDFLVDNNNGKPYFLEVNALMNLGIHGGFVESFLDSYFKSYDDLIKHIVELGLSKI